MILGKRFQSTLPAWGETAVVTGAAGAGPFQSTLPAWGETIFRPPILSNFVISIHSPRMGRDGSRPGTERLYRHFNPLSPHGERPAVAVVIAAAIVISIHSPRMGRDTSVMQSQFSSALFQSTLPAWGETIYDHISDKRRMISIHSPRMGRDPDRRAPREMDAISIHSPRMGRDYKTVYKIVAHTYFNPLSPHGERPRYTAWPLCPSYFNPLSPHGERLWLECQTVPP